MTRCFKKSPHYHPSKNIYILPISAVSKVQSLRVRGYGAFIKVSHLSSSTTSSPLGAVKMIFSGILQPKDAILLITSF